MSEESLRNLIVEKQREACKTEPGAHAVANYLSGFQYDIFEAREKDVIDNILGTLGYNGQGR
ncbi:MAG: hypothetical protein M1484_01985 [Patescibacteria group bacterium]|nr:hypothetical protein [Patescibacteria group bacterium]MCL5431851.1 hypothetical protein [Patescibacteria group bacterium]